MALKARLDTATITDNRRHPRHALRLEADGLMPNDVETNVTVHNISAAGLLIETDESLAVGDVLALDLPEIGPVGAEIVWQSERLFGCAFEQALGEAALAAAQLRGGLPLAGGVEIGPPASTAPRIGRAIGDSLGTKLNRLRRERSLTLAQVAEALDVSKPTVWAWEKGKARPLPERIGAIASVLGVSEEELNERTAAGPAASLVEECRQRLASVYGMDAQAVRIMIEV